MMAYAAREAGRTGKKVALTALHISSDDFYRSLGMKWLPDQDAYEQAHPEGDYNDYMAVMDSKVAKRLAREMEETEVEIVEQANLDGYTLAGTMLGESPEEEIG